CPGHCHIAWSMARGTLHILRHGHRLRIRSTSIRGARLSSCDSRSDRCRSYFQGTCRLGRRFLCGSAFIVRRAPALRLLDSNYLGIHTSVCLPSHHCIAYLDLIVRLVITVFATTFVVAFIQEVRCSKLDGILGGIGSRPATSRSTLDRRRLHRSIHLFLNHFRELVRSRSN